MTGSTLGIVGLGRIGAAVARRAAGFELRVLYTKRVRLDQATEQRLGIEWRELDDLLRESDVVSLHVPRTPETTGLLDARRLALLRDGAVLVNTARAEVVDRDALIEELVSGRLRAGLDVFWDEPHVPAELLDLPNVVLTPHIGSATQDRPPRDDSGGRRQRPRGAGRTRSDLSGVGSMWTVRRFPVIRRREL